jgi:hypothetical protein
VYEYDNTKSPFVVPLETVNCFDVSPPENTSDDELNEEPVAPAPLADTDTVSPDDTALPNVTVTVTPADTDKPIVDADADAAAVPRTGITDAAGTA